MATLTRTIIQGGGGNYVDIDGWYNAVPAGLNSGADTWQGVISDNAEYDAFDIFTEVGTGVASHVELITDAANRFTTAKWDTGKARIKYTGGETAVFEINGADWFKLEGLQIWRPSANSIGASDEAVRVTGGAENVVISRCILFTDSVTDNDTDGIYVGSGGGNTSVSVDNCLVFGWERGGLHVQMLAGGGTVTLNLDHNMFVFCGESGGGSNEEAPLALRSTEGDITVNAYNNIFLEQNLGAGTDDIYAQIGAVDTLTLAGSHNCWRNINDQTSGTFTQSWTNQVTATAGVEETDTANAVIITETTRDTTFDGTLQDLANNVALEAGTNRIGSEPNAMQASFATDMLGNTRPTTGVDLGPVQVSSAGGATALSGTATAELTTEGQATRTVGLSGSVTAELTTEGQATRTVGLSGSVAAELTTEGQATRTVGLSGSVTAELTTQGQATTEDPPTALSGTATAELTTEGQATRAVGLSGSTAAELTTEGQATRTVGLSGSVTAELTTQGQATTTSGTSLSGTASAELTTSGQATRTVGLSGSVTAELTTQGQATTTGPTALSGTASAELTTQGQATRTVGLSGSVTAELTTAGFASIAGQVILTVPHAARVIERHGAVGTLRHSVRANRI